MFVLSPLSSAVISELYSHCVCGEVWVFVDGFRFPYGSPDLNPPNGFTKPFGGFSISGKVHLIIV